jgi:hypothetical protein
MIMATSSRETLCRKEPEAEAEADGEAEAGAEADAQLTCCLGTGPIQTIRRGMEDTDD